MGDVARVSGNKQRPAVYSHYPGTAYLGSKPDGAAVTLPPPQPAPAPQPVPSGAARNTIAWSGFWKRVSDTKYISNKIDNNSSTWQTLTITTTAGCNVTVMLTASSEGSDKGYASHLDGSQSTSSYQLRVSGKESRTYTYAVPAGTHKIHFGYVKDGNISIRADNVTVEIQVH
jgi:phage-related tail fiber protein